MTSRPHVIHVGLHKTASTYLQRHVLPFVDDVTYLGRPYTQLNRAWNSLQYADTSRFDKGAIRAELEQFEGQRLLISDEMLSGVPVFNYINRAMVAERLAAALPDAHIVVFLRGQASMLRSLYNSWVKNIGGVRSFSDFVQRPAETYEFADFDPRASRDWRPRAYDFVHDRLTAHVSNFLYSPMIELYESLFPVVHVFLWEDFRRDPGRVLKRLSAATGMAIEARAGADEVNLSATPRTLNAMRWRNAAEALTGSRRLATWARRAGSFLVPHHEESERAAVAAKIDGYYRDDNRRLLQLRPDLPLADFPDAYQL